MNEAWKALVFVAVFLLLIAWKATSEKKTSTLFGGTGDDPSDTSAESECSSSDGGGCH